LNHDTVHDKKCKRCNETKRMSYRDAFRSLLKGSSKGGTRKRTDREENACTLDIYGNRKLPLSFKHHVYMKRNE